MKLKQRFPYLALIVLSMTLLVIMPLVNFFTLRSQKEIFGQLDQSLQLRSILLGVSGGLWKAVLILACIWLGVGINDLLLRIKDIAKRKMATNGLIFGSLFLCVALPILGLILTYAVLTPKAGWKQLPTPPETAKSIAGGVYNRIIIETVNGNYFSHNIPAEGLDWQAAEKPNPSQLPEMDESASPGIQAPGSVINIAGVPSYPGSTQKIYYVILEDHTIWYLDSQANNAFFVTALLATVFIPILTGSLLTLSGMAAIPLLERLAGRIWLEHDS